jgi:hypothetical protein
LQRHASIELLKKIPFIDNVPQDGRAVLLPPYYDKTDSTFKMYIPNKDRITWIYAKPNLAWYYSKSLIDESKDIYISLFDNLARHFSFRSIINNFWRIILDIRNCGCIIEKYFIFLERYQETKNIEISFMMETDLEYFFGNIRSIYDLLQKTIRDLWKKEGGAHLCVSFADMIKQDSQTLIDKYDLPQPLVNYYINSGIFFENCKDVRNSIFHAIHRSGAKGNDFQVIFCTKEGFALSKKDPILRDILKLNIWPEEKIKENGLISILALFAYITREILKNFDMLSDALTQSITQYLPISEKQKLFYRGPFNKHLLKLDQYIEKQWY